MIRSSSAPRRSLSGGRAASPAAQFLAQAGQFPVVPGAPGVAQLGTGGGEREVEDERRVGRHRAVTLQGGA